MTEISTRNISKEEKQLLAIMSSKKFLNMEGLGNELPFYVYAYPPENELEVNEAIGRIVSRLEVEHGQTVIIIDLFTLVIELLEERGVLERVLEIEPDETRADFRELLQGMLDPEQHLAPAIKKHLDGIDYNILIISGAGKVFPFIRTHNILNNLQSVASSKPLLVLFPGEYRQSETHGSSLVLFGQLSDDRYYRAKNILEQEP